MACNPQALADQGSCFLCLPPGYYLPVKLVILARWLKTLDPAADVSVAGLLSDAGCTACLPQGQLGPVRMALICEATS